MFKRKKEEEIKLYYQYYDLINPNLVVFLIKEGKEDKKKNKVLFMMKTWKHEKNLMASNQKKVKKAKNHEEDKKVENNVNLKELY